MRNAVTAYAVECLGRSIRKACELVGISRTVFCYVSRPGQDVALRERLHLMLRREGLVANHKRTERLYREERLGLRRKRHGKGVSKVWVEPPLP